MSDYIRGAEKKIVFLNPHKPTGVSQAAVNVLGLFSFKKKIEEQKITSIKDVTGITEEDALYKLLQALFNGGAQEVVVAGDTVESSNYKAFFDSVKNEFFGVVTDITDITEITKLSKEVGAREKMLFVQLAKETDLKQLESKLIGIAEDTTTVVVSKNEETLVGAIAGYTIPKFPGSVMIANKLVNGAVDSGLTGAEGGIADKLHLTYNAPMKGQLGIANGTTITGDPIDFIHCLKALKFRLEEDMTLYLKGTDKPSFDDLSPLKAVILARCEQFESMKALIPARTVVTFPPLDKIPANDILNGFLTGVQITVYYKYGIRELRADLYFAV